MDYKSFFYQELKKYKDQGLYRKFREIDRPINKFPKAEEADIKQTRDVEVWCTNDYLNMSQHPEVINETVKTLLEIGTGSGYQTAILSKLFKRIYTIERHQILMEKAKKILSNLKINNTVFYYGDGMKGWPAKFSFERIIITAVSQNLPIKITSQLSEGGILILPLKYKNDQYITKVKKKNGKLYFKKYWRVRFVPLVSGIN